ncbi:hypothetical protein ACWEO4_39475 [Streptomyces sp. NPDC004393]
MGRLSPAIENDRLLGKAHYAADPNTSDHQRVLSMPTAHDTNATLVYADAMDDLLTAIDRASKRVRENNPQEVGRRIVERPLTAVPAAFLNPGHHPDDDLNIIDGNSRWASCTAGIKVPTSSISPASDKEPVQLLPSHLMRLPVAERRDLALAPSPGLGFLGAKRLQAGGTCATADSGRARHSPEVAVPACLSGRG